MSTSQVCLADPGFPISPNVNACPLTLQRFTGPNATHAGAQLRVSVNANNTGTFNGYDIILLTDHTRLHPFGVDTSSSLISTASIQKECIGGVPTVGVCDFTDSVDTLHLNVGGTIFTTNPTFGVLFTAIFNIVGNTTATGAQIRFQTGCGSTTSLPPICVTLTSGGSGAVQITAVRTATYTTSSASPFQPFFTFKTKPLVLNYTGGSVGTGANANITMSQLNGFNCGGINCVDLSVIKPPVNGLTLGLNVTSVSDPPTNAAKLSVNINAFVPAGIYTIYVLGAPDTLNTPLSGTTYVGAVTNVTLTVVASSNFAIAASPGTVIANVGTPSTTTVQVAGGKTFLGTVTLSSTSPSTGIACSLTPPSLIPTSSPWLIKSTLSCTTTAGGVYTVTVNGTSGLVFHTTIATYISPTFVMTASPTSLTVKAGQTGTSTINVKSINGFSGTVSLTASLTLPGSTTSLSPSSVILTPGITNSSTLTVTFPATVGGTYTITVMGASAGISQSVSVTITTGAANIVITSVSASSISATVGQTVTVTVTLNNTGTIAGNFSLWINWGSMKVAGPVNDTIPAGQTKPETLAWDTTGFSAGSNTIVAVLSTAGGLNGPSSQANGQSVALAAAPPPLLTGSQIAIIGGIIAAVAVVVLALVLLRRRKPPQTL
jgi:hypothetical protein